MIIYKIQNKINNKVYIGQTTRTLNERKREHISKGNNGYFFIQKAIKKYGEDNFEWSVICNCNDRKELNKMEKYYIKEYDSYRNGYNMTLGGDGHKSPHSEETKNKIRGNKNFLGKKHSPETIERIRAANIGNKHGVGRIFSDEIKKKISESEKGKVVGIESRIKMSKSKSIKIDVDNVIDLRKKGFYIREIAQLYNVSYTVIYNRLNSPDKYRNYLNARNL